MLKERELFAELNLKIKENSENVLSSLLKERKLVAVSIDAIPQLEQQIKTLTSEITTAVESAVKAGILKLNTDFAAQLSQKNLSSS